MIRLLLVLFLLSAGSLILASETTDKPESSEAASVFDPDLAAELGADDYGMRRYVMAFLHAGPSTDQDSETLAAIQRGHMDHIRQMAREGHLVMAGPFLDGGELRGIFVFAVDTVEEARALTEADPAVQSGRLVMELKPWYGSAALLQLSSIHNSIARENP